MGITTSHDGTPARYFYSLNREQGLIGGEYSWYIQARAPGRGGVAGGGQAVLLCNVTILQTNDWSVAYQKYSTARHESESGTRGHVRLCPAFASSAPTRTYHGVRCSGHRRRGRGCGPVLHIHLRPATRRTERRSGQLGGRAVFLFHRRHFRSSCTPAPA